MKQIMILDIVLVGNITDILDLVCDVIMHDVSNKLKYVNNKANKGKTVK